MIPPQGVGGWNDLVETLGAIGEALSVSLSFIFNVQGVLSIFFLFAKKSIGREEASVLNTHLDCWHLTMVH